MTARADAEAPAGLIAGLDGRTRLLAALALVVTAVALRTPEALLVMLAGGLALAGLGGVSGRPLRSRLLHVEGFVVLLFVGLPLLAPDGPWLNVGPLAISQSGLARAFLLALRITAAALIVLTLLAGLTPVRLGHGLHRLGAPDRLVQVLVFTFRYVDLLDGEARRLREAMRLRGFQPKTDLHTLRTYAHLIGQMLVRAFERAERVMEAMRCRGFSGRFPLIADERFSGRDAVLAALAAVIAALAIGVEVWCRSPSVQFP